MSIQQSILSITVIAMGTALTRFLPFLVFPKDKPTPGYVVYLGKALPPAIFGFLAVYGFKDTSLSSGTFGIAEFLSTLLIVFVHQWKRNMLLSIALGTAFYMILIQLFFV